MVSGQYSDFTFDDHDIFKRKQFVDNIMNIIQDEKAYSISENKSLSICIDSPWGTGKSCLQGMWINYLIKEFKNCSVLYYNAWENDDFNDAFLPLAYHLQDLSEDEALSKFKTSAIGFAKALGRAVLKDTVVKVIGKGTEEVVGNVIDGMIDEKYSSYFDNYGEYLQAKKQFIEVLETLVPQDGKLIIFVDELDRCKPTFAVETLEVIKHYFNIENIVFVFSTDLEQLSHSIKTLYGQGMDASGYLRRFFDINVRIPVPDIKTYIEEILNKSIDGEEELLTQFMNLAENIFKKLKLSVRDINKVCKNFIIFYIYYKDKFYAQGNKRIIPLEIYLYFITMKYKYPLEYNKILSQEGFYTPHSENTCGYLLDNQFLVSPNVSLVLNVIQDTKACRDEDTYIDRFVIKEIAPTAKSFSEHIQYAIELFC